MSRPLSVGKASVVNSSVVCEVGLGVVVVVVVVVVVDFLVVVVGVVVAFVVVVALVVVVVGFVCVVACAGAGAGAAASGAVTTASKQQAVICIVHPSIIPNRWCVFTPTKTKFPTDQNIQEKRMLYVKSMYKYIQ